MALMELVLTKDDIELIRNLLDDREEAITKTMKKAPPLSISSALNEVESLRAVLDKAEFF
jgi:hypothetical protein